jgi:uncharacterized membrane protein
MEFLSLILHTIILRPYVFVFLLIYFWGCSMNLGVRRAILFCIIGYFIAWLSEYSSIHSGFPYGHYYYIGQTKGKELWVLGVPWMDSISYVFLAYASYSTAMLAVSPLLRSGGVLYLLETRKLRGSLHTILLGALLFVYLDIIIDPVALRGDRWFLGQIYGYPARGVYFGIPISNFIGWFGVGFILIYVLQKIDSLLRAEHVKDWFGNRYPWRFLIGPALYLGVVIFNLSVTSFIREYNIAWSSIFIILLPLFLIYTSIKAKLSSGNLPSGALEAHLKDFPEIAIPGYPQ